MRLFVVLILGLSLGGCGLFSGSGDQVVFDDAVGPNTQALAKTLPDNLKADSENANYSGKSEPADLKKEDPDGE